jgi:PAS domain S-box-containing protein
MACLEEEPRKKLREAKTREDSIDAKYDNVTLLAATIANTPIAFVTLSSDTGYSLKSSIGKAIDENSKDFLLLTNAVLASDSDIVLNNTENYSKNLFIDGVSEMWFFGGIAIKNKENNVVGTLCVLDHVSRELTKPQKTALIALADQLSELLYLEKKASTRIDVETALNSLLDSLGQGVYELDENGVCTYANSAMVKLTEYAIEEFVGCQVWRYVLEEDLPAMQEFYVLNFKQQSPSCEYEYRIRTKQGVVKWLHHETNMIYDQNGWVVKLRTIVRDITDTKRLEEDRDYNANLFKLLSENTSDIICLHRLDSTYDYVSSSIKETMGYAPEDIINKRPSDLIHEEDIDKMRTNFKKLLEDREVSEGTRCRWKCADGSYVWLETYTRIIKNGNGVITAIQSTSKDITQKHNEELQLISYKEGLTMLNILASIVEPKDVLIPIALKELSIYFNMTFALVKLIDSSEVTYSYARQKGENALVDFLRGQPRSRLAEGEILALYQDAPAPFRTYLSLPIYDEERLHSEIIISSFDFLEERFHTFVIEYLRIFSNWVSYVYQTNSTYRQLTMAKEKAEEAAKEKETFLSTISHEIRTPLNGIIGSVHLLELQNKDNSLNERLKVLRFSSDNLLSLVNDVLDYNKISSGNIELESSPFNLSQLLGSIYANYQTQADEKGLQLNLNTNKKMVNIYIGDSVRISQVLNNLIGNAIKFTKKGKVDIDVKVIKASNKRQTLRFSVIDTGVGISRDKTGIIFEVFKQAENYITREYGGSGLGLSITKNLLSLMNSEIHLKSERDKGSLFYFDLELLIAQGSSKLQPRLSIVEKLNLKVLLVEDNTVNRMIAREFLKNWGCKVIEAENGKKAMEILQHEVVDIVLLDLQMPVMDGYETIGHIRELQNANKYVPVLALTAETIGEVAERVIKIGMNGLVSKPFHPEELHKKIIKVLNIAISESS